MAVGVGDMPSIAASAYGSNTSTFVLGGQGIVPTTAEMQNLHNQGFAATSLRRIPAQADAFINIVKQQIKENPMSSRRLVQVFIADPDENLPLETALLYKGEQKFTDATDQELYFDIDIRSILDKHNEERSKTINKKVKERTEYLEPAKIRDLKMVVVTIAQF